MTANVRPETRLVTSGIPGVGLAYEGTYSGYVATCLDCSWEGPFRAIGLLPFPNADAIDDAYEHNHSSHPTD